MAFIPVAHTIEAVLQWLMGGQQMVNTMWFEKGSAWTEEQMADFVDDLIAWAVANLLPILSDSITLVGAKASDKSVEGGGTAEKAVTGSNTGSITGPTAPNNACGVVTFRTALTGRSYRGRNYISGISGSDLASSVALDSSIVADLLDAYDALSGVETANSCEHVVVSFFHAGSPRAAGVTTPITEYTMDTYVDSQRRRLAGRGT